MTEKSSYFPDSFYRVSVKGLCVKDGKVLFVKESKKSLSGKWELPGGGLDFGEEIHTGLRREVEEEMGLKVIKISKNPVYIWTHKYEPNQRNIGWYYSLVLAFRIEFENLDFKPSEECEEIKFFSKGDLAASTELNQQSRDLVEYFDPNDFEDEW
jgi:8-oxo-dGTP diphosphatase